MHPAIGSSGIRRSGHRASGNRVIGMDNIVDAARSIATMAAIPRSRFHDDRSSMMR